MSVDDPGVPWIPPSQRHQDRTVHAWGKSGEVVRYERAGKWYWEPNTGARTKLTLAEAVAKGIWCWYHDAGTVCFARRGGSAFDRGVRAKV